MVNAHHHHRPTLKQQNKPFKSKYATKSALKDAAKGRTQRKSPRRTAALKAAAQSKVNRRNAAKQAQLNKRRTLVSATRIFDGVDGAPRIVAVVPLCKDVNSRSVVDALADSLEMDTSDCPDVGLWKMRAERFKTTIQFINIPYRDMYRTLDACKVADYVIFVLSPTEEVDNWGDVLLRTLQAQGLPEVVTVVATSSSPDLKSRPGILRSLLSFIQYFVPTQTRVFDLHANADRLNAVRALAEGKPADVRWRDGRSWLLGENFQWNDGILAVTGVVRGALLSANRLVHLPNFGDFQISKIVSAPLPRHRKTENAPGMEVEPAVLAEPVPSSADSLVSCNDPDDLANEQTWPTEEEMQAGKDITDPPEESMKATKKRVKRIPKGMSEYQASWIVDEDEDDDEGDEDEDEDEDVSEQEMEDIEQEGEDVEELPMPGDDQDMENSKDSTFQDLDLTEETNQLEKWRNRSREEEDNLAFPDEIDTPEDIPARTRFQRYRGMRSFRTSPWDPYENLPRDYGRIFQFEDFKRTERSSRRKAEHDVAVVEAGVRVTVFLQGVPQAAAQTGSPIVLFPLLQHEHKVSVLNLTVQRNTEYSGSVRSKDPLILCVGPRRFRVNPIYSQHTRGGGKGANNVHKFERYLKHGVTNVATIYGPVTFGKQPCILLRETADEQAPFLVAMGTFMNPDTTRIIAKRIILTGHPFKVYRKTATVRYMFFNPDDIQYFKPIALHTKYGRTGHIRESLGTHGYFKAHFDGPISQMDTVCMSLYKRVYPKWSHLWIQGRSSDEMEE